MQNLETRLENAKDHFFEAVSQARNMPREKEQLATCTTRRRRGEAGKTWKAATTRWGAAMAKQRRLAVQKCENLVDLEKPTLVTGGIDAAENGLLQVCCMIRARGP